MRKGTRRLVIAFHTTDAVMATERLCVDRGLTGKLISVPRSITSDCGIAWSAPPELRPELETLLAEHGIEAAGWYELTL